MSDQHARPPITTTDAGAPASSDEHALTVGPGGPVLLQDAYLNEKLAHFVRRSSVFPETASCLSKGGSRCSAEQLSALHQEHTATAHTFLSSAANASAGLRQRSQLHTSRFVTCAISKGGGTFAF
jgi:catalase